MTRRYHRRFIDPRHQYRRWIDPRVWTLRLPDVLAYLRARDWKEVPSDREGFLIFQDPASANADGGPFYQFVPDSEEGDDYGERLFELMTGLAEFETRPASEVIDDVVQTRTPANGADNQRQQTIPQSSV
jgi:hypothetical protein